MSEIKFDDVDAINAAASDEFGPWSDQVEVTQEMINQFADVTGDHQWIHVDIEAANAGPFGGPIAHGFLTLSLLPAMISDPGVTITGMSSGINYGADKLRFLAPVPAGSKVHARSRIISAQAKSTGTLIKTEQAVHIVGNDTPSVVYEMLVLYM